MTTPLPDFTARHIGPREADVEAMLRVVGQSSLEALVDAAIPSSIRAEAPLGIDPAASEAAVIAQLRGYAEQNEVLTSLIGQGYYGTITPGVIGRNVLENPAWYTAYTPYQPEISQGRLEALVNFQTVVTDLTGLDIAGSSLLDEASAAAEAMTLMHRSARAKDDSVLLIEDLDVIAWLGRRGRQFSVQAVRKMSVIEVVDEFNLEELALHAADQTDKLVGRHPAGGIGERFTRARESGIGQLEGALDFRGHCVGRAKNVRDGDASDDQ